MTGQNPVIFYFKQPSIIFIEFIFVVQRQL
jgi:hypothetical protein